MFKPFNRPFADPVQLPLAAGAWAPVLIAGGYLLFVLKLGRKLMENRAPFDLRRVMKVYNLVQIVYNGMMFSILSYHLIVTKPYTISCLSVLPQDHFFKNKDRALCYAYYLNKILDLLDTIFIVLRKNYHQVTVLHVAHHSLMVLACYSGIRFNGYGGHFVLMGFLNVIVHTIMYSYYYLAASNPAIKQSIWWKKYITLLQMFQFIIIFGHSVWTNMQPACDVSSYAINLLMAATLFMFAMFTNFYIRSYVLPKKIKQN